jgi:hypothetical protein
VAGARDHGLNIAGPGRADAESATLPVVMQNRPTGPLAWYRQELDEPAFRARMIEEQRLIYEFDVHRHLWLSAQHLA